jgi:uracil-DNA glycosylase family 4
MRGEGRLRRNERSVEPATHREGGARGPSWRELERAIVHCRRCPRLVAHREAVAREKRAQYRNWDYWGRPVPGFGDHRARLLIVGLAPAAHGANRTGRMFTGDRSGDWLYDALHVAGFANRPVSTRRGDGLALRSAFVTAIARCAPPGNRPNPEEIRHCRSHLTGEIRRLSDVRVVVVLGHLALDGFLRAWAEAGRKTPSPRPRFVHGAEYDLGGETTLLVSYHPSQQNTFTKKLTRRMLRAVFRRARLKLSETAVPRAAGTPEKGGRNAAFP